MLRSIHGVLLDCDVLTHDEPMRSHFLQLGHDASDVFRVVHEDDDHRQAAASFDKTCGMNLVPSEEAGDGMKGACTRYVLPPEHLQNLLPLVGFREVHGHLNGSFHFGPPFSDASCQSGAERYSNKTH